MIDLLRMLHYVLELLGVITLSVFCSILVAVWLSGGEFTFTISKKDK